MENHTSRSFRDIGFIGLGAMGAHMARHIAGAGFKLHVHDTSSEILERFASLGASVCSSPKAVGDAADAVLVCLPTPDIVERVALGENGLVHGARAKIYVDHSTTGPSVARKVAEALAQRQITALDGPLAGGMRGAEAGTLSVMISGEEKAFDALRAVFDCYGRNVVHVGDRVGQGQALKLINNMIVGANLVVAAEATLFGIKYGLAAETILEMLNASTARSFVTEDLLEKRVLDRQFDFGFRLELMCKDLRLCVSEAEATGAPMMVSALAKQFYELAHAHGNATQDMTVVVRELERAFGVNIERRV
ncbi:MULTISPECIES: NAD(P)-dependent oxidoreductase [unclassified Sinorhizobium]|uniref:NAD(P)-dependent oxidoreductase n=1 Tax=unclassified Sinorhizobium TaxID=2613772 RepID=UPI0024C235A9|nr:MULTISPECIES: NAD(P)-dependent oxidoreductase [unclassified Sinorhizobium]MDK1374322.1 NAD(P)-dependent oxidoreductase [Sinorhizobium sp. 6-70]MDK1483025.1 NAD(P)-dependent oxidoreductase [Sinorhizobium sp. 6-117]